MFKKLTVLLTLSGAAVLWVLLVSKTDAAAPSAPHRSAASVVSLGTPHPSATAAGPIIALGDSLTWGYGVTLQRHYGPPPAGSYPWDLERLLHIPVVNAGVGIAETRAFLDPTYQPDVPRPPALRLPSLLALQPRLAIVAFGTSEALHGVSVSTTAANLDSLLTIFDRAGIPTVLVGTHTDCRLPGCAIGNVFTSEWDQRLRTLAATHHSGLVLDATAGLASVGGLYDIVHPNLYGYSVMAGRIAVAVRERLSLPG
jgi:lysophospholipase L1-like esterase